MRKEVIFAIAAGSVMGLIIAFGIWRLNSTLTGSRRQTSDASGQTASNTSKSDSKIGSFDINIASPLDKTVATESPIKVTGITKAKTYLSVSGEKDSQILMSGDDGSFETEVSLQGGINDIIVTAFNDSGETKDSRVMVIYSSQLTGDQGSSDSVDKKIEEVTSQPQAEMGVVTDITDNSLQIKTAEGEIMQASINKENTSFVNIINSPKNVKFEDLAIGDFVIILGFPDQNQLISAARVLITSVYKPAERSAIMGKVDVFSAKDFIVSNETLGQKWSLDATGSVSTTYQTKEGDFTAGRLRLIEVGDTIIATGVPVKNDIDVQAIHILPAPESSN